MMSVEQGGANNPDQKRARTDAADARRRLIEAGIDLFGNNGFDATSTRELAQTASVNIAGIAYHFGGKDGLYMACAEYIAEMIAEQIAVRTPALPEGDPVAARDALAGALGAMTDMIAATPSMEAATRFILREHMDPTPALDILYDCLMGPLSDRLCGYWQAATGEAAESETVRLTLLGLFGQIMIFRVARAAACRRMGWSAIGRREADTIKSNVLATLDALIAARRTGV